MAAEFHLEVMPAPMQRVFATVAPVLSAEGFYLAGGTAVARYTHKYGATAGGSLVYALTYFVDADAEPTPRMRTRLSWRTVKAFLTEQAQRVFG